MRHPDPTSEQQDILSAFATGGGVTIVAAAGSGKTTTLRMIAEAAGRSRGLYVAFNKSVQLDAEASFPRGTLCRTAHALAYRAYGSQFRARLDGARVTASQAARILGINEALHLGDHHLQPHHIARLAQEAVQRYCYSADEEIQEWHVPVVPGLEHPALRSEVRALVLPYARKAWDDLRQVSGQLRFVHEVYIKIWSLSRPQLPYDFILFDEAQDTNSAVLSVIRDQRNAQVVAVGDPSQAIYGWRGAIDAMDKFDGTRLYLSKSFRFGPEIAAEANKWLEILRAELRVTGFERIASTVGPLAAPDAVLCRTNAQAISEVMSGIDAGRRVALVGGGAEMLRLAQAAVGLKAGIGTDHPELCAFRTWAEVQDYAEYDPAGGDLKVFVRLVDKHGADVIIDTLQRLTRDESRADVVISTTHKAKGREWETVRVAPDFREPKPDDDGQPGEVSREDAMLAYVTVTRAKLQLDNGGLAWVNGYLPGSPAATSPNPHA
jgi:hypothetical protein